MPRSNDRGLASSYVPGLPDVVDQVVSREAQLRSTTVISVVRQWMMEHAMERKAVLDELAAKQAEMEKTLAGVG